MTGVLAAGLVAMSAIAQPAGDSLPLAESALVLVIGTGFVLLGWGVLKEIRLCAATAGILAVAILSWSQWRFLSRTIEAHVPAGRRFRTGKCWPAGDDQGRTAGGREHPTHGRSPSRHKAHCNLILAFLYTQCDLHAPVNLIRLHRPAIPAPARNRCRARHRADRNAADTFHRDAVAI
jgi:hypothetical protein